MLGWNKTWLFMWFLGKWCNIFFFLMGLTVMNGRVLSLEEPESQTGVCWRGCYKIKRLTLGIMRKQTHKWENNGNKNTYFYMLQASLRLFQIQKFYSFSQVCKPFNKHGLNVEIEAHRANFKETWCGFISWSRNHIKCSDFIWFWPEIRLCLAIYLALHFDQVQTLHISWYKWSETGLYQ